MRNKKTIVEISRFYKGLWMIKNPKKLVKEKVMKKEISGYAFEQPNTKLIDYLNKKILWKIIPVFFCVLTFY